MKRTERESWGGVGAVLLSATCFALTSILMKIAYNIGLSPLQVLALQSWIASLLLFVYGLLFNRRIFHVSRRTFGILAFQGLVGSLGTSILYAYALLYLPVSVAILLLYLYPALVLGANAVIWHKKISIKEAGALLLTFTGTAVASGILSGVNGISLFGILLGVASGVAYALFNLIGELALRDVSPLVAMSFAQWFSSLGLFLYLWQGSLSIPWLSVRTWAIGITLATIASMLPFYLILVGIKLIGSEKASILSTFELPMTFLLAAVFLHEFPQWNEWVGGSLVVTGIILLNWRNTKNAET